jgi:hypothetical protein
MDSFLTRSAKKLEQALGVPRPWELTPATSVGYQVATGEGSIGERARMGTAQFIGRYATNIKSPYDYELPTWKDFSPRAILKDFAPWLKSDAQTEYLGGGGDDLTTKSAEEVLYREMFDLPPRMPIQQSGLTPIGPKQYTLDRGPLAPDATEEGVNYGRVLGNYVVEREPNSSSLKYKDTWDILSPSKPTFVKNLQMPTGDYGGRGLSERLRRLIAPILRPATVSGEISAP